MARIGNGFQALFDSRDLDRWFGIFEVKANDKLIEALAYAGETAVGEARDNGVYIDHTGNLRSSVGYTILCDGDILLQNIEPARNGTDKQTGMDAAKRMMNQLKREFKKGVVLVIVAGMDYASYVEDIDSKDVLTGAISGTNKLLIECLKNSLKNGR